MFEVFESGKYEVAAVLELSAMAGGATTRWKASATTRRKASARGGEVEMKKNEKKGVRGVAQNASCCY
jgi:protein involved in polysaccharide export with SLBB domain